MTCVRFIESKSVYCFCICMKSVVYSSCSVSSVKKNGNEKKNGHLFSPFSL